MVVPAWLVFRSPLSHLLADLPRSLAALGPSLMDTASEFSTKLNVFEPDWNHANRTISDGPFECGQKNSKVSKAQLLDLVAEENTIHHYHLIIWPYPPNYGLLECSGWLWDLAPRFGG